MLTTHNFSSLSIYRFYCAAWNADAV